MLKHSFWPALELHDQLSGVSLDGKSWVGFADLVNGGGAEPFPAAGPAVFVPTREFLAAHAVAHGFFHHGAVAIGYQLLRVFDDLAALGVLEGTDDEFLAGPGRWMKRGLAREEILTILRLARRLARGIGGGFGRCQLRRAGGATRGCAIWVGSGGGARERRSPEGGDRVLSP